MLRKTQGAGADADARSGCRQKVRVELTEAEGGVGDLGVDGF